MGKLVVVVLGTVAGVAAALYLSARRELERSGGGPTPTGSGDAER